MKCSDRASLVKTWLPEKTMEGPPWLGQIVYDRALQLVSFSIMTIDEYRLTELILSPLVCDSGSLYSLARQRRWNS